MKGTFYINALTTDITIKRDIKELIPNAGMRRRMSSIVKQGVAVGMDCLFDFNQMDTVDAIITSTYLGCIQDTEKFIEIIESTDEALLNPTPFIRSTFNTIGSQIALLCNNKHYNMTYSHGRSSFEHAFLDAILLLSENQAHNILLGYYDEVTDNEKLLFDRLKLDVHSLFYPGSVFCILSDIPSTHCLAEIEYELPISNSANNQESYILVNDFVPCIQTSNQIPQIIKSSMLTLKINSYMPC